MTGARRAAVIVTGAAALAAAASALVAFWGVYNIAATEQHTAPVFWALEIGMRRSVRHHAARIEVPPLGDPAKSARGRQLYGRHCVQCHGAPGVAPEPFALGMMPAPANLAHAARQWTPAELYWTIENGVKMTGMPAWAFRLSADDLWAIVAYLQVMPMESPAQYRAAAPPERDRDVPAGHPKSAQSERAAQPGSAASGTIATGTGADAERGKAALHQYGCVTCHRIPGVVGAYAGVGPPLSGLPRRTFIAGVLPNDRANLIRWLREPQSVHPDSAMPDLGVSERDARDIAEFLQTLADRR